MTRGYVSNFLACLMPVTLALVCGCQLSASRSGGDVGDQAGAGLAAGNGNASSPAGDGGTGSVAAAHTSQIGGLGNQATLVGRFDMSDPNTPALTFGGSKIGVHFTGTSLAVMLADTGTDLFDVGIDGGAPKTITVQPSQAPQSYPIAQGLTPGEHTAWMVRRTEAWQADKVNPNLNTGKTTFYGFTLEAGASFLTPPTAKTRLIEALGDSGCTGYGVEYTVPNGGQSCLYTLATQNSNLSNFAVAASFLQAEVVNLSASGRGIYTSQFDPNDPTNQLPYQYLETTAPSSAPAWAFTAYTPDAVVINAGGDDLFGEAGSGAFPDPAAFLNAYTQLLATVRGHYAKALIVAALSAGVFGQDRVSLAASIQQAVATRVAAGDGNVVFFDYFAGNPNGWGSYRDAGATLLYGCEGHPSIAGSVFLGQQLASFLQGKLGW